MTSASHIKILTVDPRWDSRLKWDRFQEMFMTRVHEKVDPRWDSRLKWDRFQEMLMNRVHEKLGSQVLPWDFEERAQEYPIMWSIWGPTMEWSVISQLKEESIQQVADMYVGAVILFPRGDQMARGHVVEQWCDANGNVLGRAHANSILYTRLYK